MKLDVFYDFIGVLGHQIIVYRLSGLDLLNALIEAKGDDNKLMQALIYKCVYIMGNIANEESLEKITATDLLDIMEALSRQTTKMRIP